MKARLIIDRKCSRNCDYCCNKVISIPPIQVTKEQFMKYVFPLCKEVIITGGEPQESYDKTYEMIELCRNTDNCVPVYMYTQIFNDKTTDLLKLCDGFTYTIHHPMHLSDTIMLNSLQKVLREDSHFRRFMSKHLTINSKVDDKLSIEPFLWDSIRINEFILDGECPLPQDEILFELIEGKDNAE